VKLERQNNVLFDYWKVDTKSFIISRRLHIYKLEWWIRVLWMKYIKVIKRREGFFLGNLILEKCDPIASYFSSYYTHLERVSTKNFFNFISNLYSSPIPGMAWFLLIPFPISPGLVVKLYE